MTDASGVAGDRLKSFVERIERLKSEIKDLQEDVKEVKQEAKSAGFDVSGINAIIKLREMNAADRQEMDAILDVYKQALDML
jgi:uncharacterized protein (UPF0335 family)